MEDFLHLPLAPFPPLKTLGEGENLYQSPLYDQAKLLFGIPDQVYPHLSQPDLLWKIKYSPDLQTLCSLFRILSKL